MNVLGYLKKEEIVELGCDLIRQPSLTRQEGPAVKFAKDWFEDQGFDEVTLQEVEPGRNQVVARLKGDGIGKSMMFNAHLDIDPITASWEWDPYVPEGRGQQALGRRHTQHEERRRRNVHHRALAATPLDLLVELGDRDAARQHPARDARQRVVGLDQRLDRPPEHGLTGVLEQPAGHRVELLDGTQGLGVQLFNAPQRGQKVSLPRVQKAAALRPQEKRLLGVPVTKLYDRARTVASASVLEQRIGKPFVAIHPHAAESFGVQEGERVMVSLDGTSEEVIVKIDESISTGVALISRSMGLAIHEPVPAKVK